MKIRFVEYLSPCQDIERSVIQGLYPLLFPIAIFSNIFNFSFLSPFLFYLYIFCVVGLIFNKNPYKKLIWENNCNSEDLPFNMVYVLTAMAEKPPVGSNFRFVVVIFCNFLANFSNEYGLPAKCTQLTKRRRSLCMWN